MENLVKIEAQENYKLEVKVEILKDVENDEIVINVIAKNQGIVWHDKFETLKEAYEVYITWLQVDLWDYLNMRD